MSSCVIFVQKSLVLVGKQGMTAVLPKRDGIHSLSCIVVHHSHLSQISGHVVGNGDPMSKVRAQICDKTIWSNEIRDRKAIGKM